MGGSGSSGTTGDNAGRNRRNWKGIGATVYQATPDGDDRWGTLFADTLSVR